MRRKQLESAKIVVLRQTAEKRQLVKWGCFWSAHGVAVNVLLLGEITGPRLV